MKKDNIILIVILISAAFLRFWRLDSYPALNADEAAIGYNAYSLIQTGMDEHKNPWPIHFRSFNDYKPGLYFYLVLPFVKILGLNKWAVRIPSATLGVLTVLVLYFLIKELFSSQRLGGGGLKVEILAPAMLAISPWHIHFSRGGWEVNVATLFIVLGLFLFLKALKSSSIVFLVLSSLSFVLSLYTYHAARIVVPLLGVGILIIYRESFAKNIKSFALAGLVGVVAVLPLIYDFTRPEISSRAAGVGLFADPGPLARINEQRGEHGDYTSIAAKLFHNKGVNYTLVFLKNWADHFNGDFLFINGDSIQRNKVPETGQMYIHDFIFLIAGIVGMMKWLKRKEIQVVFLWLMVAPTAAALTFQSPHALRAQNMVIPLTIISAVGLTNILKWSKFLYSASSQRALLKYTLTSGALFLVILWSFIRYEHMYWVHLAKQYPFSSQYGLEELAGYLIQNQNRYEKVIITTRYDQPYILVLFYTKYPPQDFQKDYVLTPRDMFGFSTVSRFGKYEFKLIDWDKDQPFYRNSLIVGGDEEIPDEANIVAEIYGTNGYKYFQVVAN